MLSRLTFMLFVSLSVLSFSGVRAQDIDYLKHEKIFNLCSFKRECSECFSCSDQRYKVKIKNNGDKKIKDISYQFYSETFNRIITREARIEGDVIDAGQTGILYICVPEGKHWIISKLVYANGYDADTNVTFVLHDRFENFIQEPDECDCND